MVAAGVGAEAKRRVVVQEAIRVLRLADVGHERQRIACPLPLELGLELGEGGGAAGTSEDEQSEGAEAAAKELLHRSTT